MIVELIEEKKHNGEPWYIVQVDGMYVKGTGNKIIAEAFYDDVIADPSILKPKKNILKSQEIDVPLRQENNQIN
jgi:hypothetical protein